MPNVFDELAHGIQMDSFAVMHDRFHNESTMHKSDGECAFYSETRRKLGFVTNEDSDAMEETFSNCSVHSPWLKY